MSSILVLREALRIALQEGSSGVCCCGTPMDEHGVTDNHAPVDMLTHFLETTLESTEKSEIEARIAIHKEVLELVKDLPINTKARNTVTNAISNQIKGLRDECRRMGS